MPHASGTKIVIVTHDLGQARRLADEVVVPATQGRVAEHDRRPRLSSTAGVRARASLLGGRLVI